MNSTVAELESPRDVGMGIVSRLNSHFGLRLEDFLFDQSRPELERRRLMVIAIAEAAFEAIDRAAVDAGEAPDGVDNQALVERMLDGEVDYEPNFAVSEHNFRIIRDYQGEEITHYISTLAKRFEMMTKTSSPGALAGEFIAGEIVAVGIAMAFKVRKLVKLGTALKPAIKEAVVQIGTKAIVLTVVIALVALIFYLTSSVTKRILGVLFNNMRESLVVTNWREGTKGGDRPGSGLYMEHGEVKSFPVDHQDEDLDSPEVQVHGRDEIENDSESGGFIVYGGIFCCEKVFGFRGAEGIFRFTGLPDNLTLSLVFAVPYTNDNGAFIDIFSGAGVSKPTEFRYGYNNRKVNCVRDTFSYHLTARVNSARGGVVALIASVDRP